MATHIVHNSPKLAPVAQSLCNFPPALADALEQEALTTTYPTGAVLFSEGQAPRGVFIVRRGRVKLSICGSDGRTLILRIVEPGAHWALPLLFPDGSMKLRPKPRNRARSASCDKSICCASCVCTASLPCG